ncbi:MAG: pyridoxamine 5'-phosphate oxidase [Acidimicrobiia bacterium]|nr:pyridoxamine 5'-phosphate oxidase [Acidimicrobiia bacterium]
MRRRLQTTGMDRSDVHDDPFEQFRRWMAEASEARLHEPEAVVLATADVHGRPSARHVLLRGLDERGVVFYTNGESQKGRELAANPWAAMCFPWNLLARQVRISGSVEVVAPELSDAYFASRPRGSQLGAWASAQSSVLADRAELDRRLADATARFEGREVPRPPHWGGYRLVADEFEFWQGRPSRLHDRFHYRLDDGIWRIERLSP